MRLHFVTSAQLSAIKQVAVCSFVPSSASPAFHSKGSGLFPQGVMGQDENFATLLHLVPWLGQYRAVLSLCTGFLMKHVDSFLNVLDHRQNYFLLLVFVGFITVNFFWRGGLLVPYSASNLEGPTL